MSQLNMQQNYLDLSKNLRFDEHFTVQGIFDLFSHLSAIFTAQGTITQSILKMVASLAAQKIEQPQYTVVNMRETLKPKKQIKTLKRKDKRDQESLQKIKKPKLHPLPIYIDDNDDADEASSISLQLFGESPMRSSQNLLMNIFSTPQAVSQNPIITNNEENKIDEIKNPLFRLFKATLRQKDQRKQLNGYFCQDCKEFAEGLNLNAQEKDEWCKKCSRHRGNKHVMHQDLSLFPTPDR